jgi:hypothetical protein
VLEEPALVEQRVEQRVHPGEPGDRVVLEGALEVAGRPRRGDQDVAPAHVVEADEVHGEREDVVERQRGEHRLLARRMWEPHIASICSVLATRLPCDSIAPLETPVVPPVYCSAASESRSDALEVGRRRDAALAPLAPAPARRAAGCARR